VAKKAIYAGIMEIAVQVGMMKGMFIFITLSIITGHCCQWDSHSNEEPKCVAFNRKEGDQCEHSGSCEAQLQCFRANSVEVSPILHFLELIFSIFRVSQTKHFARKPLPRIF